MAPRQTTSPSTWRAATTSLHQRAPRIIHKEVQKLHGRWSAFFDLIALDAQDARFCVTKAMAPLHQHRLHSDIRELEHCLLVGQLLVYRREGRQLALHILLVFVLAQ
eukprot:6460619-Amphidinium_carterae.1